MNEANRISVCGFLGRFFGTIVAVVLIIPLLMAVVVLILPFLIVAELICISERVANRLWDFGGRLIRGTVE